MKRLLIIEDDRAMADGLSITLKSESIDVEKCYDITTAKKSIREKNYNLIILDIGLPDGSGLDLLQEIRRIYRIPVILLTANDTETDVVMGLELGAADYITKPFSLAILRAKVNTELNKVEIKICIMKPMSFSLTLRKWNTIKEALLLILVKRSNAC